MQRNKKVVEYVQNPITGRMVKIGGKVHAELVATGAIGRKEGLTWEDLDPAVCKKFSFPMDIWGIVLSFVHPFTLTSFSRVSRAMRKKVFTLPIRNLASWVGAVVDKKESGYTFEETLEKEDHIYRNMCGLRTIVGRLSTVYLTYISPNLCSEVSGQEPSLTITSMRDTTRGRPILANMYSIRDTYHGACVVLDGNNHTREHIQQQTRMCFAYYDLLCLSRVLLFPPPEGVTSYIKRDEILLAIGTHVLAAVPPLLVYEPDILAVLAKHYTLDEIFVRVCLRFAHPNITDLSMHPFTTCNYIQSKNGYFSTILSRDAPTGYILPVIHLREKNVDGEEGILHRFARCTPTRLWIDLDTEKEYNTDDMLAFSRLSPDRRVGYMVHTAYKLLILV